MMPSSTAHVTNQIDGTLPSVKGANEDNAVVGLKDIIHLALELPVRIVDQYEDTGSAASMHIPKHTNTLSPSTKSSSRS